MRITTNEIIRAWKDEEYRATLPNGGGLDHPAGLISLDDETLEEASGSMATAALRTLGCCYFSAFFFLCTVDSAAIGTYGCCADS